MKTFHRICVQDYTITDKEGTSFTLKRGREYLTSEEKDEKVCVLSTYWVWVWAFSSRRWLSHPNDEKRRSK